MADNKTITLPDVGDFKDIEVIEILISAGDEVEAEQSIIILESDKATMEIPSPYAGKVESVEVKVGDRLNEGDKIATLSGVTGAGKSDSAAAADKAPDTAPEAPPPEAEKPAPPAAAESAAPAPAEAAATASAEACRGPAS